MYLTDPEICNINSIAFDFDMIEFMKCKGYSATISPNINATTMNSNQTYNTKDSTLKWFKT
jgi:hypothetical protein